MKIEILPEAQADLDDGIGFMRTKQLVSASIF